MSDYFAELAMIEVQATFAGITKGAQEEAKVTVDSSPFHRWKVLSFLFDSCLSLVLYNQSSAQMCFRNHFQAIMGHCGSLVDLSPFVQRIVGSNPALDAM